MSQLSELPCPLEPVPQPSPPKPFSHWAKKFLACNPMYLGSAALLLLGIYQVSIDPAFLRGEIAQLGFNLSALQVYELLLVVTALWLARRSIWYDAGLLVGLENMLVLVPFILVSQAALISKSAVWLLCIGAGAIAAVRFAGLKRFLPSLNLPARAVVPGVLVLMVNVALPIVYRLLHENKVGTHVFSGAAFETNEFAWALLLPVICSAANLLPAPLDHGRWGIQRRWVPLGCFSLWLGATVVHLYCLGYVYDFPLRAELVAPLLCIACWTLRNRIHDFRLVVPGIWRQWLLVLPLIAGLIAVNREGSGFFLQVSMVNAALYAAVCWCERKNRLSTQLLWLSLVCVIAAWPSDWVFGISSGLTRGNSVGLALLGYLGCSFGFSRNPKTAVISAISIGVVIVTAFSGTREIENFALQSSLVLFLAQSMRWIDSDHPGARALRIIGVFGWVLHSWCWIALGGPRLAVLLFAVAVLLVYLVYRMVNKSWWPVEIAIATALVFASLPGFSAGERAQALPFGVLLIAGSFLLFGLGTLLALTRHRWHRTGS